MGCARAPALKEAIMTADTMLEATRLTREGRLTEAAALLQRLLRREAPNETSARGNASAASGPQPRIFDVHALTGEASAPAAGWPATGPGAKAHMPEALRGVLNRLQPGGLGQTARARATEPLPKGAEFLSGSFTSEAGHRGYKLYIPGSTSGAAMPLVVMLHGCTQSPDDFAAGTRMNALAEEHGCLILYPGQTQAANAQKCWNWFSPADQRRDQGEPALIAGMTRQVMREYAVDPARVYVAGLSAGGAAAAIMARAYPELYAAVGVHSGLACGAARDMPSAFAAMRQGAAAPATGGRTIPTIVFHADQDQTVHPRNGDQVITQSAASGAFRTELRRGQVPGGHAYSQTIHRDAAGQAVLEQWLIHGGGHAWSGGSAAGSYTDPRGPDASREMLRFFLEQPQAG